MKRKRRPTPPGEFHDPLSDYAPPSYHDELERSLCEDGMSPLQTTPVRAVPPTTTIADALKIMDELGVASLLITSEDGKLLGVFSERDVVNTVAEDYERIKDRPIRSVMTRRPISVYETDGPAKAMNMMAVGGFRHIPIVDLDDRVVGVLGPRRLTAYLSKMIAAGADEAAPA